MTFCEAKGCVGDENLVALPSEDETAVTIRDWRCSPASVPLQTLRGAGVHDRDDRRGRAKKYGMVTSLAMISEKLPRPILVCGLESGHVMHHELGNGCSHITSSSYISVAKDPILCLDVYASTKLNGSISTLAGCAGSGDYDHESAKNISIIKTSSAVSSRLYFHYPQPQYYAKKKFGISCCKFSPDGRMFAVGSWDSNGYIFPSKIKNKKELPRIPHIALKWHEKSITSLDWSHSNNFLAVSSDDGRISIWNVMPNLF